MSWIITGTEKYETDPHRSQVSLLLHGDGTNGSTTITDSSPSPKTVTVAGNAQISTAQSKFGGSSLAFDGSGDYLQASSATLDPGGDFTVEAWAYLSVFTGFHMLFSTRSINTGSSFGINNNGKIAAYSDASGVSSSSFDMPLSIWTHLAYTYSSGRLYIYANGVNVYDSVKSFTSHTQTWVGTANGLGEYWNGYIDDLRITKGVARYTSNFTPPTAPFPDI